MIDYSVVVNLVVEILKAAIPVGLIFILAEKLLHLFFKMAFPKTSI